MRKIEFCAPAMKRYSVEGFKQSGSCSFAAVSITGGECELMCDHCRAVILGSMPAASTPAELVELASGFRRKGARGLLVSGGCDAAGVVPLEGFTGAMAEIGAMGLDVLVHTAVTSDRLAKALADAGVKAAMMDVVGDSETLGRVCHLDYRAPDFCRRSLEALAAAGVPLVPHLVIGLDYGQLHGEYAALEMLRELPLRALVLVVLRPLPGTPMEAVAPPSTTDIEVVFRRARERFPDIPVNLGCERPAGEHRRLTEMLALEAGLDGIAYPSEETIAAARSLGCRSIFSEACCALVGTGRGNEA